MARHPEIYADPEWKKVRRFVIVRANGLCEGCQRKGVVKSGREVDHIVELTDENKHDWNIAYNPDNLQLLCPDCHNQKHDRSIGLQSFLSPP
ncbi:HNH endonuclease [Cohnella cholangitidis]|uniref:Putative HNH nuclease YajD n=1 Tax=Cohnella cholangitidis TaxID=2598458 RepID=A0A7G5C3E8_9BACL|nr:HNH endonuclease [Cohnella cholangitidis]